MPDASTKIELIPVKSQTRTIQTCFQQCLYEVPNFQRPYSWTSEQLEDFWEDVVLAKGDFFFGSTVTWVSQKRDLFNDTYSIIDGQQRLTTSAIILSVVRDAFSKIGSCETDGKFNPIAAIHQAAATQRYLIATDDDGNPYEVLKRSERMFYEVIQNPSAIPSGVEWNGSAIRIGEARDFFERCVTTELSKLDPVARIGRLKTIRANVLKARVIQVELASEEDGFLIFETLNTRGANLRLSDLVKNLLIRGGANTTTDRQAITARWERVADRVQFGRVNPDVFDRFIWQSWNSRRGAVKEPELFKEIGNYVAQDSVQHLSFLSELEVDSSTYEWLEYEDVQVHPKVRGERNAFSIPEFVDSVRALEIFHVSVANSTVMAIARKYQETRIVTEKQLVEVVRMVENFHFQFTALTNSGSTGGTRGRYNRFAVRLESAKTSKEVTDAILDFKEKLRASLPSPDRAEKAFRELFYAPRLHLNQAQKLRARRIFISYILINFAMYKKLIPAGQNLSSWSIEHIKPQSQALNDHRDAVYSIGNLTLLTAALNGELGDAPLQKKIAALRNGNAYLDSSMQSWDQAGIKFPSDAQIAARSKQLANEALGDVWSI